MSVLCSFSANVHSHVIVEYFDKCDAKRIHTMFTVRAVGTFARCASCGMSAAKCQRVERVTSLAMLRHACWYVV